MATKHVMLALGLMTAMPAMSLSTMTLAQGTVRGAAEGADQGAAAAGPVGAVVGGAVGAATGTVGGVIGVPADRGCESRTIHRENGAGESETIHRTNCP